MRILNKKKNFTHSENYNLEKFLQLSNIRKSLLPADFQEFQVSFVYFILGDICLVYFIALKIIVTGLIVFEKQTPGDAPLGELTWSEPSSAIQT